ncbi:MAG: hypothetical protein JWO38_8305 [Gemmataceae bacterium]|nr:hypothetical protein [Gemmataceae bacterium]
MGAGVLNFHDLPVWCQQTYRAVAAIGPRGHLTVADSCEMAAGHHAGDRVAEDHPLHDEIRRLREEVQRGHHEAEEYRRRGAGRLYDDARAAADQLELQTADQVQSFENEIWTAGAIERVNRAAAERAAQAGLVRCLMGSSFRTAEVDPAWLTTAGSTRFRRPGAGSWRRWGRGVNPGSQSVRGFPARGAGASGRCFLISAKASWNPFSVRTPSHAGPASSSASRNPASAARFRSSTADSA